MNDFCLIYFGYFIYLFNNNYVLNIHDVFQIAVWEEGYISSRSRKLSSVSAEDKASRNKQVNMKCQVGLGTRMLTTAGWGGRKRGSEREHRSCTRDIESEPWAKTWIQWGSQSHGFWGTIDPKGTNRQRRLGSRVRHSWAGTPIHRLPTLFLHLSKRPRLHLQNGN